MRIVTNESYHREEGNWTSRGNNATQVDEGLRGITALVSYQVKRYYRFLDSWNIPIQIPKAVEYCMSSSHSAEYKAGRGIARIFAIVMIYSKLLALALFALPSFVSAVDPTADPDLDAQLKLAATNVEKHRILQQKAGNDSWIYDFTKHPYYTFSPGGVINANAATFPATVGTGMTVAVLNLGPCSMLPPHLHPRATNFVVAIHGKTQTFMYNENGVDPVITTLTPGKLTIFPAGSMHMMQNIGEFAMLHTKSVKNSPFSRLHQCTAHLCP